MNATLTLLTALLFTAPAALRAADVQGQERVELRLGFADDADLKVIGNVKVGIALAGDELAASVLDCAAMPRELSFRVGSAASGPVNVKPGAPVTLRFFADRSLFELYANDEAVISNAAFFHNPDNLKAAAMHRNGPEIPLTVDGWEMGALKWFSATRK